MDPTAPPSRPNIKDIDNAIALKVRLVRKICSLQISHTYLKDVGYSSTAMAFKTPIEAADNINMLNKYICSNGISVSTQPIPQMPVDNRIVTVRWKSVAEIPTKYRSDYTYTELWIFLFD